MMRSITLVQFTTGVKILEVNTVGVVYFRHVLLSSYWLVMHTSLKLKTNAISMFFHDFFPRVSCPQNQCNVGVTGQFSSKI